MSSLRLQREDLVVNFFTGGILHTVLPNTSKKHPVDFLPKAKGMLSTDSKTAAGLVILRK